MHIPNNSSLVQACASLEPNYQPPVTFIVVQKRHHTRLFANNHRDKSSTDRSGNILPGNCFVNTSFFDNMPCNNLDLVLHLLFLVVNGNNFLVVCVQAQLLIQKSAIQQNSTSIYAVMPGFR